MNHYLLYSLFLCLFVFFPAQAQNPLATGPGNRDDNMEIINHYYKGILKNAPLADDIAGSPFLTKNFEQGKLFFPDHPSISANIRYDMIKEEMQVLFEEDNYRVLHDGILLEINGIPFKKFSYLGEKGGTTLLGYFEILSNKNKDLLLLQKHYKEFKRGRAEAAMQKGTPDRLVNKRDFYLKFSNSTTAKLVDKKLKNFLSLFPLETQNGIKAFIEDKNLNLKKEQDLITIVEFYNSTF